MRGRLAVALVILFAVVGVSCSKDPEIAKQEYMRSGDAYVRTESIERHSSNTSMQFRRTPSTAKRG
jgi:hypothetical protein